MQLAVALLKSPLRWLLLPLWLLYAPAVWLRNWRYDRSLATSNRLPVPVICIGNLSSGGTGKTPLVNTCIQLCRQLGFDPAVISRGYHGTESGNDEAQMMLTTVHCDPDRTQAGKTAIAAGADLLIMDDGLQHRRLQRDANIVTIDATQALPAWHRTLPMGLFREGPSALQRAAAVVITRCDQATGERITAIETIAQAYDLPTFHCQHQAQSCVTIPGETVAPPTSLSGTPVWLACGIGNPQAFHDTVAKLGADIRGESRFADHHHYTQADIRRVLEQAQRAEATVVITEKDAVKWQALLTDQDQVCVLTIAAHLNQEEAFADFLKGILVSRQ